MPLMTCLCMQVLTTARASPQTSEELSGRSSELEAAQRRIDSLEREVDSVQRALEVAGAAAAEEVSSRHEDGLIATLIRGGELEARGTRMA